MNRFRLQTPSRTLAACAVLAAAATLGLAVVLPAHLPPVDGHALLVARAPTPVTIVPGRIDVVAARRQAAASNVLGSERTSHEQG